MKLFRWICFFIVISWAGTAVQVQAQSIADVARQERARKKAVENKATITPVTNASIAPVTSGAATPPNATTVTAEEVSKTTGPVDLQGHDEKYWRTKFDAARDDLKRADDNLKLLDLKVADLNTRLLSQSVYTEEIRIRGELEKATQDQAVARKALADAQQKIVDLEDDLHRAGGPPGWARP